MSQIATRHPDQAQLWDAPPLPIEDATEEVGADENQLRELAGGR